MARWLYTLFILILAPFFLINLKRKANKYTSTKNRWSEYLGLGIGSYSEDKPIWIHSVSVGESMGIVPLVKKIKLHHPDKVIVVTTTTATGAQVVMEQLKGIVIHHFMPLDIPWCIHRFIKRLSPSQLIIMETELWPNTLAIANSLSVPITVINARLSQKSCKNYQRLGSFFRTTVQKINTLICQNSYDKQRFESLGIDPNNIIVSGSLKFDIDIPHSVIQKGFHIRSQFKNRPVWIAASTHTGEDEQLLSTHQNVLKQFPNALLILVPRHPERFDSVYQLSINQFITQRRTDNDPISESTQVYLADTMGELVALLSASDVCFMAGSLLGHKVGGHNPLEPAAVGLPIITGPSYFNFKEIYQTLFKLGIATEVTTTTQISQSICEFFGDTSHREKIKEKGQLFVEKNKGALNITYSTIIKPYDNTKIK